MGVQWTTNGAAPEIHLDWTESGGPAVQAPAKHGFGITLIEKSVGGVGGSARLDFDGKGLRCSIRLPLVEDGRPAALPREGP